MKRQEKHRRKWSNAGSWVWLFVFGLLGVGVLLSQPQSVRSIAAPAVLPQLHAATRPTSERGPMDSATISLTSAVPSGDSQPDHGQQPGYATRRIESLRVGDRVLARNPEIEDAERNAWAEPDWSTWLKLTLEMPKPDGSTLAIEMLRPESWVIEQTRFVIDEPPVNYVELASEEPTLPALDVPSFIPLRPIYQHIWSHVAAFAYRGFDAVGITVQMDLPELGLTGEAWLIDFEPVTYIPSSETATGIASSLAVSDIETVAPEGSLAQRYGSVITATFCHSSGNVIDLVIAGAEDGTAGPETIGTTSNHPFWSVDRHEYVQASSLEVGERVLTYSGDTRRITSKLARPGPQPVYNLEVYGEHVFFVGEEGVLVHNSKVYGTVYKKLNENYVGSAKRNAKARYGSDDVAQDIITDIPVGKKKPHDVVRGVEQVVMELLGGPNTSKLTNVRNAVDPLNKKIYYKGMTKYEYRTSVAKEFLKQRYGRNWKSKVRQLFDVE